MRRRPRVLALVLAGGEGGRMGALTDERAKPALPFAGVYRLIDFPLSNCSHSGIEDVWVFQQYQPQPLTEHVANGRPWDLDRTHGGLRVIHPYLGDSDEGWYEGNADALYRNRDEIAEHGADITLVLSADHLYRLDYRDVVDRLVETGAGVTMVTTQVGRDEAGRFGVVEVEDGRIVGFEYKPDEPRSDVVTTEVFSYDTKRLLEALEELGEDGEEGSSGLHDFGHELLPRLVDEGSAYEFRLDGYWRDVGTIESYWEAHMDLLGDESGIELDRPDWPILTRAHQRPPAHVETAARVEDSLLSPGSRVAGHVVRSVLSPGVVVERGAELRDAIVLHDAVVRAGAVVERAIVDERAEIGPEAHVGAAEAEIAVVPQGDRVTRRS